MALAFVCNDTRLRVLRIMRCFTQAVMRAVNTQKKELTTAKNSHQHYKEKWTREKNQLQESHDELEAAKQDLESQVSELTVAQKATNVELRDAVAARAEAVSKVPQDADLKKRDAEFSQLQAQGLAASKAEAEKDTENTQLRKQLEAADKTATKKDDELTQLQEELGAARQDAEKSAADNTAAVARLQLDLQAAQASKAEKEAEQDTQNSHLDTIVCASCFCQRCLLLDSAGASPCFTTCMCEARLGTSLEYLSCCAVRCVTARLPPGL